MLSAGLGWRVSNDRLTLERISGRILRYSGSSENNAHRPRVARKMRVLNFAYAICSQMVVEMETVENKGLRKFVGGWVL